MKVYLKPYKQLHWDNSVWVSPCLVDKCLFVPGETWQQDNRTGLHKTRDSRVAEARILGDEKSSVPLQIPSSDDRQLADSGIRLARWWQNISTRNGSIFFTLGIGDNLVIVYHWWYWCKHEHWGHRIFVEHSWTLTLPSWDSWTPNMHQTITLYHSYLLVNRPIDCWVFKKVLKIPMKQKRRPHLRRKISFATVIGWPSSGRTQTFCCPCDRLLAVDETSQHKDL